jgi:hypothetical protein
MDRVIALRASRKPWFSKRRQWDAIPCLLHLTGKAFLRQHHRNLEASVSNLAGLSGRYVCIKAGAERSRDLSSLKHLSSNTEGTLVCVSLVRGFDILDEFSTQT